MSRPIGRLPFAAQRLLQTVTTDPKGNKYYNNGKVLTSRYKYKYDSHGNWTKKYSGRTLLVVRKITYYD
ncbi:MAG: hypothetical protein IKJ40_02830 [Bacteroidales bacterium]|nr:hypothetical protein [Bacteroidales bacterium]